MPNSNVTRSYKDRLFRVLFSNKKDLLSLYNAMNGSDYQDPDALEITTMEDVLYMAMKNDVSFLIENFMNLYEHQSSRNPNMPLRGLFYFSRLYSSYVESRQLDLYSSSLLKLPTPRYFVFYNGTQEEPEIQSLLLSDSFEKQDTETAASLECIATVLNINYGHNQELMKNCRRLYEYSYLVNQIRKALEHGMRLEAAIEWAIQDCLQNEILKDFLTRHREEAKFLILSEYNEELHRKTTYNEGMQEGQKQINSLFKRLLQQQRLDDMKRATEDPEYQKMLLEEFGL